MCSIRSQPAGALYLLGIPDAECDSVVGVILLGIEPVKTCVLRRRASVVQLVRTIYKTITHVAQTTGYWKSTIRTLLCLNDDDVTVD